MFVEIDQPLQLKGTQPVALHAPETAWRIDGGGVDVFVQPVRAGRPAAHARRLFRAEAGQALLGIDRDPNADGLLLFARATPGTQLVEVQLASIRANAPAGCADSQRRGPIRPARPSHRRARAGDGGHRGELGAVRLRLFPSGQ